MPKPALDRTFGERNEDDLDRGIGNDVLIGGRGGEFITGGEGDARLQGSGRDDRVVGGDGGADMRLTLAGTTVLSEADFML
ncbi:hypothetical protein ABMC89_04390 [Sulfitobacter sp. HNIBRBA3233]|uniref:hypothetical protein n=1 Tax=Sulfitobacter marinivivus TaxID=3158558 RepID=UPI0032DF4101